MRLFSHASSKQLPKEEMLQIMEGVSTWQPGQGWKFKLEYDEQFATEYPLIVKQQSDQWKLFHNRQVNYHYMSKG